MYNHVRRHAKVSSPMEGNELYYSAVRRVTIIISILMFGKQRA